VGPSNLNSGDGLEADASGDRKQNLGRSAVREEGLEREACFSLPIKPRMHFFDHGTEAGDPLSARDLVGNTDEVNQDERGRGVQS
jgi:hypothetical protein